MSAPPLVSVVVPCFDAGPMLAVCLESCRAQTHPNVEIVFVDNNSTDGSAAIAARFAAEPGHPIRLEACSRQGQAFARNHGLARARGDYIQWLDADDALAPDKIARQVAAMEADAEADIAYGDWLWREIGDGGERQDTPIREKPRRSMRVELLCDHWRAPNGYLVRRAMAERLRAEGVWNPETPCAADREYFTLAALIDARFLYVPGSVAIYHRWGGAQITARASRRLRREALEGMFRRFRERADAGGTPPLTGVERTLLDQDWADYRVCREQVHLARGPAGQPVLMVGAPPRAVPLGRLRAAAVRVLLGETPFGRLEEFARAVAMREPEFHRQYPGLLTYLAELRDLGFFVPAPDDEGDGRP